jgi:hypothetical protein
MFLYLEGSVIKLIFHNILVKIKQFINIFYIILDNDN